MGKQVNFIVRLSTKYFKTVANYILKNRTPILIGVGTGATAVVVAEEASKSKERKIQQEKNLLYKEALTKQQAKNDAICEENKELKEILSDIVIHNNEANYEKV